MGMNKAELLRRYSELGLTEALYQRHGQCDKRIHILANLYVKLGACATEFLSSYKTRIIHFPHLNVLLEQSDFFDVFKSDADLLAYLHQELNLIEDKKLFYVELFGEQLFRGFKGGKLFINTSYKTVWDMLDKPKFGSKINEWRSHIKNLNYFQLQCVQQTIVVAMSMPLADVHRDQLLALFKKLASREFKYFLLKRYSYYDLSKRLRLWQSVLRLGNSFLPAFEYVLKYQGDEDQAYKIFSYKVNFVRLFSFYLAPDVANGNVSDINMYDLFQIVKLGGKGNQHVMLVLAYKFLKLLMVEFYQLQDKEHQVICFFLSEIVRWQSISKDESALKAVFALYEQYQVPRGVIRDLLPGTFEQLWKIKQQFFPILDEGVGRSAPASPDCVADVTTQSASIF
jgi:hypothetical protein